MLKEDFSEENLSYIDDTLKFSFAKYVLWNPFFTSIKESLKR